MSLLRPHRGDKHKGPKKSYRGGPLLTDQQKKERAKAATRRWEAMHPELRRKQNAAYWAKNAARINQARREAKNRAKDIQ